jgi:hypothetical protein
MRGLRPAVVGLCAALTAGCAWRGYNGQVRAVNIGAQPACAVVGIQNLDSAKARAVLGAVGDVCRIVRTAEFRDSIAGRKWLASCESRNGGQDEITGDSVLTLLLRPSAFSVHPRKPWGAFGLTDRTDPSAIRVAVYPRYIKAAVASAKSGGSLRNTVAHEMTHVVSGAFKDRGHGPDCLQRSLVSYAVGNLVAALWQAEARGDRD